MVDETKRCSRCQSQKPVEDFNWKRIARGQRDSYCRPCRAAYKQEHYARNKQRYNDNAARWNKREFAKRLNWIVQYLEEHPCVDCGETDVSVLEFDHGSDKLFDITYGFRFLKWETVLEEIEKCDVRCANCHRKKTAAIGGFTRFRLSRIPQQGDLFGK